MKLSPTVCGKDVESILTMVKSDEGKEIDVNVTVISISSADIEPKADEVPLNLTTEIKKEVDSSACKVYSDIPTYSQVQTQDCQSEYISCVKFVKEK